MTDKDDRRIEQIAHEIAVQQAQELIRKLAEHLSSKTIVIEIPKREISWLIPNGGNQLPSSNNYIRVPLFQFFDMMMGYNVEENTLVYWREKSLDNLYIQRVISNPRLHKLLWELARSFSVKTKLQVAPPGYKFWEVLMPEAINISKPPDDTPRGVKVTRLLIDLEDFFGMRLGYDAGLDLMVVAERT